MRLDPRSPEFDALYLEVGDRASGWLVAESLDNPWRDGQHQYHVPALDQYDAKVDPPHGNRGEANHVIETATEWVEPTLDQPANVISSQCSCPGVFFFRPPPPQHHHPTLDVDMEVRVVPSSTKGHYHLYFPDLELSWEAYERLLGALSEAGIISANYARFSTERKQTFVRLPWVRKKTPSIEVTS